MKYYHLIGKIAVAASDHIVVDLNGVGYIVNVPKYDGPWPVNNGLATVYVYDVVDKRSLETKLYGFRSDLERELFGVLCSVTGVGPVKALKIMNNDPQQIVSAAVASDNEALEAMPSIGSTIASGLVGKRKRLKLAAERSKVSINADVSVAAHATDTVASLGFARAKAAKVVSELYSENPSASASELVKLALSKLK